MKYLIKKDFTASRLFIAGATLYIPILTLIAVWTMVDHFGGIVIGVFTLIVIVESVFPSFIFLLVDSTTGAERTFVSLPVKRRTIVISRYVESIIQLMYSFSLVLLTCITAVYILNVEDQILSKMISINAVYSMLFFLVFILIFLLPFIFKSGAGGGLLRATIALIFLLLFLPLGDYLLYLLQDYLSFDPDFFYKLTESVILWLKAQPVYLIKTGTFLTIILFFSLSLLLSIHFYNKRDID